ncbi:hypothetical protein [Streptomyces atroolivaceus]|uniref:hypothetical protein n=1 Tax=Streptomyces atroolivaceus TaxID=66869 RepID=UPI0034187F0A
MTTTAMLLVWCSKAARTGLVVPPASARRHDQVDADGQAVVLAYDAQDVSAELDDGGDLVQVIANCLIQRGHAGRNGIHFHVA